MTEKEKMLNEKMYECNDEELVLLSNILFNFLNDAV